MDNIISKLLSNKKMLAIICISLAVLIAGTTIGVVLLSPKNINKKYISSEDEFTYSRVIPDNLINSENTNENNSVEGLLNPSIVGINKNDFYNEIKYPVPSKVDYFIKATDHGVVANDKKDDTLALKKALDYAKSLPSSKTKKIILPSGDIDFFEGIYPNDPIYGIIIDGIDNLIIEGQNTNIYFYYAALGFKGFYIANCKNLLLTKFNVDWGTLPFVSGSVVSYNAKDRKSVV